MRLWDLVFVVLLLGTGVAVLRIAVSASRREWARARRIGGRTGVVVASYLLVVVVASLVSPRRWIALGEEQRFDDWAITITSVEHEAEGFRVRARVANHGRGRPQRAADAALELLGSDGRRFPGSASAEARSLQSMVEPGESFETEQVFTVPPGESVLGLDVLHGGWPELFIVGDRGSLFRKRPLVAIR